MEDNAKVVAVLGRNRRLGRWRVAGHTLVVAVFGACELDLTRALIDEDEEDVSFSVFALFGSVTVHLRRGTDVQPSGIAIASSATIDMDQEGLRQGTTPVSLEWTTLFSRMRVTEDGTQRRPVPEVLAQPTSTVEPEPESEPDPPEPADPSLDEASLQNA